MKKIIFIWMFISLFILLAACGGGGEQGDALEEGDLAGEDGEELDAADDEGAAPDGREGEDLQGEDQPEDAEIDGEVECEFGSDCDDLEPCNGQETCDSGFCRGGTPLPDGDPCLTAGGADGTCSGSVCVPVECGNGIVDAGEECDDGNTSNLDACLNICLSAWCGDGFLWEGTEQCDDGNDLDIDACPTTCTPAECGDGFLWEGMEECDDGNLLDNDSCLSTCVPATCGDGFLWEGVEECDDGNTVPDDGCTNTCTLPACGDGIVQGGEECDDGNTSDNDSCLNTCASARCGDGIIWTGREACDDGNTIPDDLCTNECRFPGCGDCILQSGEACDDCNADNTDACLDTCLNASCGDGYIRAGVEQCDDGNTTNTDACLDTCIAATCGDGFVHTGVEQCDDGNTDNTDACLDTCRSARCGDGFVHAGVEECDDGNGSNMDACLNTCVSARCGDGFVRAGVEQCDDGNSINTDDCLDTCAPARCGDGFVHAGVEQCDDANTIDTDACLSTCVAARCGDGFVWSGVEQCDDGNTIPDDGCTNSCTLPSCGDCIVQSGEDCDDCNTSNADSCLNTCITASCGDGFVRLGVEQCDDGDTSNTDACLNTCILAFCGDGYRWAGIEQCDDANTSNNDACLNTCENAGCGDGFIWTGMEQCDDGNFVDTDDCLTTCQFARCGDGFVWQGVEQCDDANGVNTDACPSTCLSARCGDGFVWTGVEECDDANGVNTDTCVDGCLSARCGDGFVWTGRETCDDGNTINGDGCNSTCSSVLACTEFTPVAISVYVAATIIVTGEMFAAGMHVHLVNVTTLVDYDMGAASVNPMGNVATVTVPTGAVPSGKYNVRLVNPDTSASTCFEKLAVRNLWPPTVTSVVPAVAWRGDPTDGILSDQPVTITGTNFRITPTVRWILTTDPTVTFDAAEVNWISDTQLTAICPSESMNMPLGLYYVEVINPEGLSGRWSGQFEVTDVPPPEITSINPTRGARADTITMTITGQYFQSGASVFFELADGSRIAIAPANVTFISSTQLRVVIPGGTLPSQGLYPVWVRNPDGREDVYYSYNATSSASGHWNDPFTIVTGRDLLAGRERHDMAFGCDIFGSTYMYVVGGITGANVVLDDTEVAEVSLMGDVAPWAQTIQYGGAALPRIINRLNVPRNGLAVVRFDKWLYAIGGADADTNRSSPVVSALSTIERATVLGYETMPRIQLPILHGGSGLPFGTWYYRISAIGPWGESLGSKEIQAKNTSGVIDVCWHAVPGATSYNVYRSPAADGRSQTARLLVKEVAGPCYTDNGRGVNQPAPGRLAAETRTGTGLALGTWTYRVTAVVGGTETIAGYRETITITSAGSSFVYLTWDPMPGATFNIYRAATPVASPTGNEETYLLASGIAVNSFTDNNSLPLNMGVRAPDGIPPLPPGSLGKWQILPVALNTAREGSDAIAVTVPSGSTSVPDRTFIYVLGGRPTSSGGGYLRSVEKAEILSDGSLSAFTSGPDMNQPRAFLSVQTTWHRDDTPACPPPPQPPCENLDGDGHDAIWCGGDDCNDHDPTIYPGAPEICGDGIDQDCDGRDPSCVCFPADADGDGHARPACGGDDCCDEGIEPVLGCAPGSAHLIYPGATEVCENGIDEDCDTCDPLCTCTNPLSRDKDNDGYIDAACCGNDCNDNDPNIYPGAPEIMCDGIDQDCDGIDQCIPEGITNSYDPRTPTLNYSPWEEDFRIVRAVVGSDLLALFSIEAAGDEGSLIPAPKPSYSLATETLYLVASMGDNQHSGTNNDGQKTFEVSVISTGAGALGSWSQQSYECNKNQHGHAAFLYAGYTFISWGVDRETLGAEPNPLGSSFVRFPINMTPSSPPLFLGSQTATASRFTTDRCYYSDVRLNSFIYVVGGNSGAGPVRTMEKLPE